MTSPLAFVQVSVNGGPWLSGGLNAVPFGATVDLRNASSAGVRAYVWELTDYPPGMPCPAGWSNVLGVYTYSGAATPPTFTLPTSGVTTWGKVAIRLRLNGNPLQFDDYGAPVASWLPNLTDTTTVLSIPSPTAAMPGFMFGEGTQFDAMRSWAGAIMANLRAIDSALLAAGAAPGWTNLSHATTGTVLSSAQIFVTLDTTAGDCLAVFPAAPRDALIVRVADPPAGSPLVGNWASRAGKMQGNTGQYVENPTSPGTFSAAAGVVSMPPVNRATQDFQYHQLTHAWLLV